MFYYDWSWEKTLLIVFLFGVVNALPMWMIIYANKHIKPDKVRDAKYAPWVRNDFNSYQSYTRAYFTHFFFIPRVLIGWGCILLGIISVYLIDIGEDTSKP